MSDVAPTPGLVTGLDDVTAALRDLRAWAGSPSYTDITRRVRDVRLARGLPPTEATPGRVTVYDCFRDGRERIDVDLVVDIADALGGGPEARGLWRHAARSASSSEGGDRVIPTVTPLPPRPRHFVGRDDLVKRLSDASAPRVQLICGLTGTGKTTLAVMAAHEMRRRRAVDEVIFADLAEFSAHGTDADPFDVIAAILRAQPTADGAFRTPAEQQDAYVALLRSRRTLLVLDDVATSTQVESLLPQDPITKVIVTSRWAPEVVPGPARVELDGLDHEAAIDLLEQSSGRTLTHENHGLLTDLCRLTGRLPLSLALLGRRLMDYPGWSVNDHVEAYRERLDSLQLDDDLHGALGTTYAELPEADRCALRRLGLHPTSRIGIGAAAALTELADVGCRAVISNLERRFLLRSTGSGQWQMHSVVHAFARQMALRDERPAAKDSALERLMDHYIRTTASAVMATVPASASDWYWLDPSTLERLEAPEAPEWLRREHSNLIAVAEWMADHGFTRQATRLVAAVSGHLWEGGDMAQALTLQRSARAAAATEQDLAGQALAERNLGMTHIRIGRYATAHTHLTRARDLFSAAGDTDGEASALNNLAIVATKAGDYPRALTYIEEVCDHHRQAGDDERLAGSLTNRSVILSNMGEVTAAIDQLDDVAELSANRGFEKREQMSRSNLAGLLADTGDPSHADRAIRSARRAVQLARRRGDDVGLAYAQSNLAASLHLGGELEHGLQLALTALETARRLPVPALEVAIHNSIGEMCLRDQARSTARHHFEQAIRVADEIGEAFERDRAQAHLDRLDESDGR